jgi:hypothetical protein
VDRNGRLRRTSSTDAPLVFVAYQHAYPKWLEELKSISALIHSERIEFFSDHQIGGSEEWDPSQKAAPSFLNGGSSALGNGA